MALRARLKPHLLLAKFLWEIRGSASKKIIWTSISCQSAYKALWVIPFLPAVGCRLVYADSNRSHHDLGFGNFFFRDWPFLMIISDHSSRTYVNFFYRIRALMGDQIRYISRIAYYVLRIAYCVLRIAYCVLRIACCVLRVGYCVLGIAYWVLRK